MNPKSKGRKKPRGRVKAMAQNQGPAEEPRHVSTLEQELAATKEYLQSMIETQEATNEELRSANEALEATKEELQSANDELATGNGEIHNRNLEITRLNNDLTNLFASIHTAVVLIGSDLTIRGCTAEAQRFLGLTPADVGRPLLNTSSTVELPDFQSLVSQVIGNSRPLEREFKDTQGARFLLKILPYRTVENKIDGAVITVIGAQPNVPPDSEH